MPQRQFNVQQQNAKVREQILGEAKYWRTHAIPEPLRISAQSRGVQWERSIIIYLDIDFPGMPQLIGVLLTQEERFIRFEISTDEFHTALESVDTWDDITHKQNVARHNRGIGVGRGALAIEVLRELNT